MHASLFECEVLIVWRPQGKYGIARECESTFDENTHSEKLLPPCCLRCFSGWFVRRRTFVAFGTADTRRHAPDPTIETRFVSLFIM